MLRHGVRLVEKVECQPAFESEPPDWDHFAASHLPDQRHVPVERGRVLGWVASTAVSDRFAYAGVAEHSVYVTEQAWGRASV
jgi:L-amino acid N-acyltransferase YncA